MDNEAAVNVITHCYDRLQRCLPANDLIPHMFSQGLITDTEKQDISAVPQSYKKNDLILDALKKRSNRQFEMFLKILQSLHVAEGIAQELTEAYHEECDRLDPDYTESSSLEASSTSTSTSSSQSGDDSTQESSKTPKETRKRQSSCESSGSPSAKKYKSSGASGDGNDDARKYTEDISFAIMTANGNEWNSAMYFLGETDREVTESFKSAVDDLKTKRVYKSLKPDSVELGEEAIGYRFLSVGKKNGVIFQCTNIGSHIGIGSEYKTVQLLGCAKDKKWPLKTIFIVGCCGAAAKGNPLQQCSERKQHLEELKSSISNPKKQAEAISETLDTIDDDTVQETDGTASEMQKAIKEIKSTKMAVDRVQKGVTKVDLGTVFIGKTLYQYTGKFEEKLKMPLEPCSLKKKWISQLQSASNSHKLLQKIKSSVVPFYSGDFVIKDQDIATDLNMLLQNHPMIGFEMEGIGAVTAVELYPPFANTKLEPDVVLVKGVSDNAGSDKNKKAAMKFFAEDYKEVDEDTRQQMCTAMSLALVLEAIGVARN